MTSLTEIRISKGLKASLGSIAMDLKAGNLSCLYFATEVQIDKLITRNMISEDYSSHWQDYQEEMRCMLAEF